MPVSLGYARACRSMSGDEAVRPRWARGVPDRIARTDRRRRAKGAHGMATWTQAQVNRAVAKLQAFLDKLPEDEQQILGAILRQAADRGEDTEVRGYSLPP